MNRCLIGALLALALLACAAPPAQGPPEVAEVAEVECGPDRARLLTTRVAAGPGGVRVRFTHPPLESGTVHGYSTGWSMVGFTSGGGVSDAGGTTDQVLPLPPGARAQLTCSPPYETGSEIDGGDPQWAVRPEVVDLSGAWRDTELACDEVTEVEGPAGAQGPRAQADDLARDAFVGFFGSAVDPSEVERLGYPDAAEPIYGVLRDGHVLARVQVRESGPLPGDLVIPDAVQHCDRAAWPPLAGESEGGECPGGLGAGTSYAAFLQLDGRQYLEVSSAADEAQFDADELGVVVGHTRCRLSDTDGRGSGTPLDGDAAFLPPGTALHAVEGFASTFRLGALHDGDALLYEVDSYKAGSRGADVLDIAGRVEAITINADAGSGETAVGQITDPEEIERLVQMMLDAPYDPELLPGRAGEGAKLFLEFELAGTPAVSKTFWTDEHLLHRGIQVPEAFTSAVTGAVR